MRIMIPWNPKCANTTNITPMISRYTLRIIAYHGPVYISQTHNIQAYQDPDIPVYSTCNEVSWSMILCDSDCFVRFTDVIFHVYSESSWPLYLVIPGDTSSIIVRIIEFHGHDICLFAECPQNAEIHRDKQFVWKCHIRQSPECWDTQRQAVCMKVPYKAVPRMLRYTETSSLYESAV